MNDIDELMNRDPLELTADDIDSIIAYHRRNRAKKETTTKAAKESIDLVKALKIGAPKPPADPTRKIRRL